MANFSSRRSIFETDTEASTGPRRGPRGFDRPPAKSAADGWDEWGDGGGAPAPAPQTRAKGADPDVLAKRAALKAKLERKKQLAAEQRPKVAAKAKPAAAKAKPKDVDDWESW